MKYSYENAKSICMKYDPSRLVDISDEDFEYVHKYIGQSNSIYELGLLRQYVPLGMLKFRLQERIKYLTEKENK